MKKMIGRLMAMCLVAVSLAAFAQSGDNMLTLSNAPDERLFVESLGWTVQRSHLFQHYPSPHRGFTTHRKPIATQSRILGPSSTPSA